MRPERDARAEGRAGWNGRRGGPRGFLRTGGAEPLEHATRSMNTADAESRRRVFTYSLTRGPRSRFPGLTGVDGPPDRSPPGLCSFDPRSYGRAVVLLPSSHPNLIRQPSGMWLPFRGAVLVVPPPCWHPYFGRQPTGMRAPVHRSAASTEKRTGAGWTVEPILVDRIELAWVASTKTANVRASVTIPTIAVERFSPGRTWVDMIGLLPPGGTFARRVGERLLLPGFGTVAGSTTDRLRPEDPQEPQVAWYARSGRNSCHSCCVRLRPATSHARLSQSDGSTSQSHADPVAETTTTLRPREANEAATASLGLGPGRGPAMTVPFVTSQSRTSPKSSAPTTVLPSGLMSTVIVNGFRPVIGVPIGEPDATSQRWTMPSVAPVTSVRPSFEMSDA